jgi:hypothetical protein
MKNLILGIIALGVLGACNSEPKDEVGRYLPLTSAASGAIVDTKTGIIYEYRYDIERYTPYGKKPIRVLITKVNPISKEVINFYSDIKIGK